MTYSDPFITFVGDGTANPQVITHNLGTRGLNISMWKNGGTFELIKYYTATADTKDTITIRPDVPMAANGYVIAISKLAQSDITPPTAPTLSLVSNTHNAASVTATGATDDSGALLGYYFYNNGVYAGASGNSNFTYTGLTPSTTYSNLTAAAVDVSLNIGPMSAPLSVTTNAQPVASLDAVGTVGTNYTSATPIAASDTVVVSTPGETILVGVLLSHNGWTALSNYTGRVVSSSIDGALTLVPGAQVSIGTAGQEQGGILVYELSNASVGTHTISASIANGTFQNFDGITICAVSYKNISAIGTPVTQTSGGSASVLAVTVPGNTGDIAVCFAGFASGISGFNKTTRAYQGAAIPGLGDYLLIGEAAGATSNTFSTTSSSHQVAAVAINLSKVP